MSWRVQHDHFENGCPSFDVVDHDGNDVAYFLREEDAAEYCDWKASRQVTVDRDKRIALGALIHFLTRRSR